VTGTHCHQYRAENIAVLSCLAAQDCQPKQQTTANAAVVMKDTRRKIHHFTEVITDCKSHVANVFSNCINFRTYIILSE